MVILEKKSFDEEKSMYGTFSARCFGLISGEGEASSLNAALKKAEANLITYCHNKGIDAVFGVRYNVLSGSPNFKVIEFGEGYTITQHSICLPF